MEGSKIYFTACLLSTLYTVCTSYCPSQLPYKNCSRYYDAVEAALLKDQYNKYQLHEEFFPSSHSEPLYGHVNYTNLTVNGYQLYRTIYFWSSSFILTYIDPTALNSLQLRLMDLLLDRTGVLYHSSGDEMISNEAQVRIVQLTLTLDLNMDIPVDESDVFDPSNSNTADAILMDFTSWVSSYLPGLL